MHVFLLETGYQWEALHTDRGDSVELHASRMGVHEGVIRGLQKIRSHLDCKKLGEGFAIIEQVMKCMIKYLNKIIII